MVTSQNEQEAFVQTYWARASFMGEAIKKILDAAKKK